MKTVRLLFAVLICSLMFTQMVQAQNKTRKRSNKNKSSCINELTYDEVLGYLFPQYFLGLGNGYAMAFRYSPFEETESQVTVFHPEPGKYEVYLYRPENGNIDLQLQTIKQRKGCANYQNVKKLIKVKKTRIYLTEAEVKIIQTGFFETVRNSLEFEKKVFANYSELITIRTDGTGYEVWYYGEGQYHLSGNGNSIYAKAFDEEPPFVEWMRRFYKMIETKL